MLGNLLTTPHTNTRARPLLTREIRRLDRLPRVHLAIIITKDIKARNANGPRAPRDADVVALGAEFDAGARVDLGPVFGVFAFTGVVCGCVRGEPA